MKKFNFTNKENNKIDEMIAGAIKNLSGLIDVNSVVGKPMKTEDGCTIIPISKVTMGFLSGGGEYGNVKILKEGDCYPFSGGTGAVLSMKPSGFLIDKGNGFKVVNVASEPYEKLFETAQEFLSSYGKNND